MKQDTPDFDSKWLNDKLQLSDAVMLPQRIRPLAPPPNRAQGSVHAGVGPAAYQTPAGAPNPGAAFGAPSMGGPQPMATQFAGVQGGVQGQIGPMNVGAQGMVNPQGNFQGANVNAGGPMGDGNFNVNAALDNAMRLQVLQGRYSQGPFSASASYSPQGGVGGGASYQNGPLSVSGGYDQARGANASVGMRQAFNRGGFAAR